MQAEQTETPFESYEEALKVALYQRKWVVKPCFAGISCWCRLIELEIPVYYKICGEVEMLAILSSSASMDEAVASYIVDLHNNSIL